MKIAILVENTSSRDDCVSEFGLSFFIEANGRRVLFDAGQTGKIVDNAQVLDVDLESVDTCVLSHGHYDHANGFPSFFQINGHAPLYVRSGFDSDFWAERGDFIGVTRELVGSDRVVVLEQERFDLGDGFTILSYAHCEPTFPIEPFGLYRKEAGTLFPDDFLHEQYLLVVEGTTRLLVSGCSHRGIRNILRWSANEAPTHVLGGFHFMKVSVDDATYLDSAADDLLLFPVTYMTCHCTG